jgi:hypothetical protein
MKTPSQDLHKLIKSLTKTEKRYFSQFAEKHVIGKQNNYYKLFKVVDNQLVYDENQAKKEMEKQDVSEHFTALKFQLTERILEALHGYHQKNSIAESLKRELNFCRILIHKNLIEAGEKRLKKVRKTIEVYNFIEFLPELFAIKREIFAKQFYKDIDDKGLETIYEDMELAIEQLKNWNQYEHLNILVQRNHYQKIRSTDLDFEILNQNEWLNDEKKTMTFRSKMSRLSALATLNFMQGRTAMAYQFNQEFIALLEESKKMTDLYANRYVSALSNILIDSLVLGKYDLLQNDIQKLREITQNKTFQKQIPNLEMRVFRQTYLLEMNWAISTNQFSKGIELIPFIEDGLKIHRKTIGEHNQITFYYLFAYCNFREKYFSDALTFVNEILDTKAKSGTEIVEFTHLLNVLTHFELSHYDLLAALIPSTRRFLRKKRPLYKTEDLVFSHLKKIINTVDKSKKKELWTKFKAKVLELKKDKNEARVFNYFDFETWERVEN